MSDRSDTAAERAADAPGGISPAGPSPGDVPFVPVARIGDIPAGQGCVYEVGGRLVAVFFDGERHHAIDDLCPHMGASLGSGPMVDGVVTCPWHAWRFRLCDGAWCDNPKLRVDVFEVRVVADTIEVRVPPPRRLDLPETAR
jgi:nitrite reductase (NADH) small subunit/3-phenylpropionate/trans-cinnamate dioxygenase ferredoxin subunit